MFRSVHDYFVPTTTPIMVLLIGVVVVAAYETNSLFGILKVVGEVFSTFCSVSPSSFLLVFGWLYGDGVKEKHALSDHHTLSTRSHILLWTK